MYLSVLPDRHAQSPSSIFVISYLPIDLLLTYCGERLWQGENGRKDLCRMMVGGVVGGWWGCVVCFCGAGVAGQMKMRGSDQRIIYLRRFDGLMLGGVGFGTNANAMIFGEGWMLVCYEDRRSAWGVCLELESAGAWGWGWTRMLRRKDDLSLLIASFVSSLFLPISFPFGPVFLNFS